MISLPIANISATSGEMEDGFFVGGVNKSNPVAVLMGDSLVNIEQVLRKAVTATGVAWEDFTTRAKDAATADFPPFGTASDMSIGDALYFYVTDGEECNRFYVQIATPGVGTWTVSLQEWDETADAWTDISGLNDTSNGFRAAAGVYEISFSHIKKGKTRLDDTSAKHVWHRFYISAFTSATTAPVLSRMWASTETKKYRNITASHTSDPDDFSSLPAEMLPRVGDEFIIVHPGPSMGEDIVITRSASANYTAQRYYLASDNTYKLLSDVNDASDNYRTAASTTERKARWTVPSDWTSKSVVDKDNATHTGWIESIRITAVGTEGPVLPPQVQCKSRSFGNANTNGIVMLSAFTVKGVSMPRIGVPSTTATVVQLFNLTQGQGASFTIPANATSANVDTADVTFAASDKLGMAYLSGGEVKDLLMILHT